MFLDESSDFIIKLVDVEPLFEKKTVRKIADETLYYSPEYCKTKKKTKSNDIWAIGMIAYQLLTNYQPYRQSTS
jgi:serine/threonine protein kinase